VFCKLLVLLLLGPMFPLAIWHNQLLLDALPSPSLALSSHIVSIAAAATTTPQAPLPRFTAPVMQWSPVFVVPLPARQMELGVLALLAYIALPGLARTSPLWHVLLSSTRMPLHPTTMGRAPSLLANPATPFSHLFVCPTRLSAMFRSPTVLLRGLMCQFAHPFIAAVWPLLMDRSPIPIPI